MLSSGDDHKWTIFGHRRDDGSFCNVKDDRFNRHLRTPFGVGRIAERALEVTSGKADKHTGLADKWAFTLNGREDTVHI
jgi:hypothetical protein